MQHTSRAYALTTLSLLLPVLPSLAGCEKDDTGHLPVSRQSIAQTAENNLRNVTTNLTTSLSFVAESDAVAASLGMLSGCETHAASPSCAANDPQCVEPPSEMPASNCDAASVKNDMASLNRELQDAIDQWVMKVRTEIFTDTNIENESATEIVYKLPVSLFCGTSDAECAHQFARSQPRLRVTSPSQGDIDVALLLTMNKFQPATLLLHRNKLGVRIDLAEVRSALAVVEPESASEIARMAGVVELALVKNGERNFSFIGEIKRAINVASAATSADPFELMLAATDRTYELRLDGVAQTITASINLGALQIAVPLSTLGNTLATSMPDLLRIVVGGLNGSLTFTGNTDTLAFRSLGLGNQTTKIRVNDHEVFALDVNQSAGRRFDLTISMAESSTPLLAFTPGLDVSARFHFQPIANRFTEPPPAFLLDDTLGFQLSGTNPSIRLHSFGTEVISGTLHLTSTAVPAANITVAAGQCLVASGTEGGPHKLLSSLTAGMCQ